MGVWITFPAIFLRGLGWLAQKMEVHPPQTAK
jgi:hypothetical protein